MQATQSRKQMAKHFLVFCAFVAAATTLSAQSPPSAKITPPPITVRLPRELLTSPRETVKTLYYAIIAYDIRPQLVDEAVACLDLDPARAADAAEAARLAIELDQILRILCVPLNGVPEKTDRKSVTLFDAEGFKISLARGIDGLWRFDRDTVDRIPAMNRMSLARFRDLQTERAALREPYTDPSATMLRFLIDTIGRDFYSAARSLDLSGLPLEERADKGPVLARQLAIVMQRRGWMFLQEVPNHPNGPPFTWHADKSGRIVLQRVRSEGKEAWLFSTKTVRNIPAMYEQAKNLPPDGRYVRLGVALPPLTASDRSGLSRRAPGKVPPRLGSPRAMLEGFFRVMDAAETRDSRLVDALEFLDLSGIPQADQNSQGTKLACKLEALLRKTRIDLSSLPDDWNAPMQVLGENQGVRVEIVRQRDGCWRFSQSTVTQTPAFFDRLTAKDKAEPDRLAGLASARDTMSAFLRAVRRGEYEQAAECLDLSRFRPGTQDGVGPMLAFKLKYAIDRIGRVYIQEVPDAAEGPRYVFYRGELGRIVIARKLNGPRKGSWLFTPETVRVIEPMFRAVIKQPVSRRQRRRPGPTRVLATPGLWVRFRVPDVLRTVVARLQLYQWLGLALAALVSILVPWMLLAQVHRFVALILRKSGSVLTKPFVAAKLRPMTWVAGWWLLFQVLGLLDLPIRFVDALAAVQDLRAGRPDRFARRTTGGPGHQHIHEQRAAPSAPQPGRHGGAGVDAVAQGGHPAAGDDLRDLPDRRGRVLEPVPDRPGSGRPGRVPGGAGRAEKLLQHSAADRRAVVPHRRPNRCRRTGRRGRAGRLPGDAAADGRGLAADHPERDHRLGANRQSKHQDIQPHQDVAAGKVPGRSGANRDVARPHERLAAGAPEGPAGQGGREHQPPHGAGRGSGG